MAATASRVAIAEIAGRDSVAAAVAAVLDRGFTYLVPTIALVGTEIGDFDAPLRAVEALRELLGRECEVTEPIHLAEPALWSAINAGTNATLQRRYGLYSPCLGCHLYMHLLRVPLAWELDGAPVIAGERDTHDGQLKLSQTHSGIDAAVRVLAYAGVDLLEPVRHSSGEEIAHLVGGLWEQGAGQLGCLLSGNYRDVDGSVRYDEAAYARYLAEFLEPVGRAVIDAWRAEADGGPTPDWAAIVRGVLNADLAAEEA